MLFNKKKNLVAKKESNNSNGLYKKSKAVAIVYTDRYGDIKFQFVKKIPLLEKTFTTTIKKQDESGNIVEVEKEKTLATVVGIKTFIELEKYGTVKYVAKLDNTFDDLFETEVIRDPISDQKKKVYARKDMKEGELIPNIVLLNKSKALNKSGYVLSMKIVEAVGSPVKEETIYDELKEDLEEGKDNFTLGDGFFTTDKEGKIIPNKMTHLRELLLTEIPKAIPLEPFQDFVNINKTSNGRDIEYVDYTGKNRASEIDKIEAKEKELNARGVFLDPMFELQGQVFLTGAGGYDFLYLQEVRERGEALES